MIWIGILCIAYGLLIMYMRSGTRFHDVWIISGSLILLRMFLHTRHLDQMIPSGVFWLLRITVIVVGFILLVPACLIFCHFHDQGPHDLDLIIVLGAQVKPEGPSRVLKYRLDAALAYLNENPNTVCIVSGGQGRNEPESEACAMKRYLCDHGIQADRILCEDRSVNTMENLKYSYQLKKDPECTVGIVTNNFHVYRGISLAEKTGFSHVYGIAAKSTLLYLPNNALRECMAVIKDVCMGNMNL